MEFATVCTFTDTDIHLLTEVRSILQKISEVTPSHNGYKDSPSETALIVCKAISRVNNGLIYVEGMFCHEPHCWLKSASTGNIIDALPMCMQGPVLLSSRCKQTQQMYQPKDLRICGMHHIDIVNQVERALLPNHNHLP